MYKIKVTTYEPIEIDPKQLVYLAEAARMLRMTKPGIISAINRGQLTEIIDDTRLYHQHRLLLRSEIEAMVTEKL
jgi:hypothetical protein